MDVFLRLRNCDDKSPLYRVVSDVEILVLPEFPDSFVRKPQHAKSYSFAKIFPEDTTQKEIFEKVVKNNLNKLPGGQSYNLMTYGASGSGKTYTLMGTVNSPGLMPRSLEYLFKIIDAAQQPQYKPTDYGGVYKLALHEQEAELNMVIKFNRMSAPLLNKYRRMSVKLDNAMSKNLTKKIHYVWVSFLELYKDTLYDLLNQDRNSAAAKLRIREDSNGMVYAQGATQAFVRSGEEAYQVMVAGKHNLQVATTGANAQSSRSHCIFIITLITKTDTGLRATFVRLCDLAGCERADRTNNTGARMVESRAINTSLHVLQRCLHALRINKPYCVVPYRESKLTRLLGSCLSGSRGETVNMVMTINPDKSVVNESRKVMQLAAVVNDIHPNQTYFPGEATVSDTVRATFADSCVSSLRDEIKELKATVEMQKLELEQCKLVISEKNAVIENLKLLVGRQIREEIETSKENKSTSDGDNVKDGNSETLDQARSVSFDEDDDIIHPSVIIIDSDSDEHDHSLEPRFRVVEEDIFGEIDFKKLVLDTKFKNTPNETNK